VSHRGASGGAPAEWIDGCGAAQAARLADLDGLSDVRAAGPSALSGWSVESTYEDAGPPDTKALPLRSTATQ
jgi:hypothetical protein